jgi:UrcA family protein
MKTLTILATVLAGALLVAAGLSSAPAAYAEQPQATIQARFAYNPDDSAQDIYSGLKRTARHACQPKGKRPLAAHKDQRTCLKQMLDDGVAKIGRADIAALHNGSYASAGTRG